MATIPTKVKTRLTEGIKRFKPIVAKARDKDVNESDTVTIIADILSEVFGYDKYTEITSEFVLQILMLFRCIYHIQKLRKECRQ